MEPARDDKIEDGSVDGSRPAGEGGGVAGGGGIMKRLPSRDAIVSRARVEAVSGVQALCRH